MRQFLRVLWVGLFALALFLPSPGPAQPNAEGLSEEALSKLSDLQSLSQQLAQQQGQFAGKSIGPQFASVTNQLQSFLLNFDIWACATAVTAFGIKQRELAVAAARAQPPDPALDRAVQDLGNLIAQLQELCNRHVYEMYDGQPTGGGTAGTPPSPPVEEPPPPRMSVQERICYDRCHELYNQFVRAEFDYDRARREAERDRQRASDLRREADQAAERARTARRRAEETQREFDRLQAEMTGARTQAERMRIADRLSRVHPENARKMADDAQRAADEAPRAAEQAADRAARSEASASLLYDAMTEIYRAWLRCIQACVEQARIHDRVTIDPFELFPGMPQREPQRPPFYRPATPAPPTRVQPPREQQQSARPLDPRSARLLAAHNEARAAVGVPSLQWDPALQESATAWATQLARIGRLEHAPREGRGIARENLSSGRIGWTPEQLMQNWLREQSNFVPGTFPNVSRTGRWEDVSHYTQIIWPTTTNVGCGIATGRGFQWLVCRYSPGGNRDGKPVGRQAPPVERGF